MHVKAVAHQQQQLESKAGGCLVGRTDGRTDRRLVGRLLRRLCALSRVEFSLPLSLMRRRLHFNMSVFYKYTPCRRLSTVRKRHWKRCKTVGLSWMLWRQWKWCFGPACPQLLSQASSQAAKLPHFVSRIGVSMCSRAICGKYLELASCCAYLSYIFHSLRALACVRLQLYVCMSMCALKHTNWKGNEKFVKWAYRVFDLTLRF